MPAHTGERAACLSLIYGCSLLEEPRQRSRRYSTATLVPVASGRGRLRYPPVALGSTSKQGKSWFFATELEALDQILLSDMDRQPEREDGDVAKAIESSEELGASRSETFLSSS